MFLHEIVSELKTYMDPTGRGGNFVVALVGDTLREPMTDEEVQADMMGRILLKKLIIYMMLIKSTFKHSLRIKALM